MLILQNHVFQGLLVFFFLLPPLLVLLSPRVHGVEKAGWVCLGFVFSWLGLAAFLITNAFRREARS